MRSSRRRTWLRGFSQENPDDHDLLKFRLTRLATRESQLAHLDERVDRRSTPSGIEGNVRVLKAYWGVGTLTAVNVLVEFGDPRRFPNHGVVACYTGLAPREYSSGNKLRR